MCARHRRGRRGADTGSAGLPWDDIRPTLDLHGETAASARVRAERWLREHQRDGVREVRIVTGRGLHSVGPPVLPGEVSDLLRALTGTVVARSDRDPGGGAFLVELHRPKSQPPGPRQPSRTGAALPSDPELRRRAEESLEELGISPTPDLIAAEMKRLGGTG